MHNRLSIGAVERETGVSKDTLRVWERRYGFPAPQRQGGDRIYSAEDVAKLRLIRKLTDRGLRPGALVRASFESLAAMEADRPPPAFRSGGDIEALVAAVRASDLGSIRQLLRWQLTRHGLSKFAIEFVSVLNARVGDGWATGEITAAQEHLYAEQVESVLRWGTAQIDVVRERPRVLLTTLPGERHRLGLLMVEAVLACERIDCFSLGVQTPISDIAQIVLASEVDIVGLSFSAAFQRRLALEALTDLRIALPEPVTVWAGGQGVASVRRRISGVHSRMTLTSAVQEARRWQAELRLREVHRAPPP